MCVYYRLGQLRLPKLWELGVSSEDIFQHNLFYQEYLWTVSTSDNARGGAGAGSMNRVRRVRDVGGCLMMCGDICVVVVVWLQVVRPLDSARVTIVFDLQGLSFTDVSTEVKD